MELITLLQGNIFEATFVALLVARRKAVMTANKDEDTGDGHILSKLVAYCSDQVRTGFSNSNPCTGPHGRQSIRDSQGRRIPPRTPWPGVLREI